MNLSGNTILITGGGSGIGRGFAERFHAAGNRVIIAGRRREALAEAIAANPGMEAMTLDIDDPAAISKFAEQAAGTYPDLNVLVNNAGIMRQERFDAETIDLADAEATITTNLLGPIRLTAALLPHLTRRPSAAIINVSSALAFVPLASTPTYCATKAAIRSFTQSVRFQLRHTGVRVIELIPPAVATPLLPGAEPGPHIMALDDFIARCWALLEADPGRTEICVEQASYLRDAAESGRYEEIFGSINAM